VTLQRIVANRLKINVKDCITMKRYTYLLLAIPILALSPAASRAADDLDDLQEKAIKAAVLKVAPCVVQIETQGGTELVTSGGPRMPGGPAGIRLGTGPTTGLTVHGDGYVISSAFNFANKPQSILVSVPGHKERYVAEIVANDQTRMLTLLKLIGVSDKLTVPVPSPKSEMRIGQTALAVGRTLTGPTRPMPSVSVGIISALDRIWGKAIQTDAKVSPTNYGGPLIDLYGRVQGVLVPASPRAEGETAGFEWYDSGIGFAIPLEDINRVLPKMLKGTAKDVVSLKRGLLGVTMQQKQGQDEHSTPSKIASVSPASAAEKRGLKPNDTIKKIDGKPITGQAQMRQILGPKYAGDTVALTIERDKKEIKLDVTLESAIASYPDPFLGILPMRDDPEPGVEVRFVYPGSPADKAGIKVGDRIMRIVPPAPLRPQSIAGRDQLLDLLEGAAPGTELSIEVKRDHGKKTETLKIKLAEAPEMVPTKTQLPEKSSAKKALAKPRGTAAASPQRKQGVEDKKEPKKDDKKAETGFLKRTTAAADHTYWIYVPENYDSNIAHAVLVWLHPPGKNKEKDFDVFWQSWQFPCEDYHIILVCPQAEAERGGWTQSESEFVQEAVRAVSDSYTVDRRRIIAHGMDQGGEMAFALGFRSRGLFRGVATTGSALSGSPRDKVANQPLGFFLVVGDKDPLLDSVKETRTKLTEKKYPVIYREIKNLGRQYIDGRLGIDTLDELARWIDSLDRF
jgi:S1-C subfamily serine protease/predicted esterase